MSDSGAFRTIMPRTCIHSRVEFKNQAASKREEGVQAKKSYRDVRKKCFNVSDDSTLNAKQLPNLQLKIIENHENVKIAGQRLHFKIGAGQGINNNNPEFEVAEGGTDDSLCNFRLPMVGTGYFPAHSFRSCTARSVVLYLSCNLPAPDVESKEVISITVQFLSLVLRQINCRILESSTVGKFTWYDGINFAPYAASCINS